VSLQTTKFKKEYNCAQLEVIIMLSPEKLKFSLEEIANSNEVICISMSFVNEWDKTAKKYLDKKIGIRYTIVLPQNAFEKIEVFIPNLKSEINQELLEESTQVVTFDGFVGKFRRNYTDKSNPYTFSATATDIHLIEEEIL